MMRQTTVTVLLVLSWCAATAGAPEPATQPAAEQLPPAPDGFVWEACGAMDGAVLRPQGWFIRREERPKERADSAYFVTKEPIEKGKFFETGLTINVVTDVRERTGLLPSEWARAFLREAAKKFKQESASEERTAHFRVFRAAMIDNSEPEPLRIRYLFMANDRTGTVHVMFFESPVRVWEQSWELGRTILDNIWVSPKV